MHPDLPKILIIIILSVIIYYPQTGYSYLSPANANTLNEEQEPVFISEQDKKEARKHYRRGKNLMLKKEYDEAVDEFRIALAFYPKWKKAQRALSWAIKDKKRKELEKSAGSSNLQEMVLKAQEYYNKGQQLEDQGNPIEAAAKYKAALRIIPGYPEALAALDRLQVSTKKSLITAGGTTYKGRSRTDAPSHRLTKGSDLDRRIVAKKIKASAKKSKPIIIPSKSNASISDAIKNHFLVGTQAINARDYALAINEFELILEFMPNHSKALFHLNKAKKMLARQIKETKRKAQVAKDQGDKVAEISALRDMVNMDPNNPDVRHAWERAKSNKEEVVHELYRRGVEAYATGQYQEALQAWDLVLDLDPQHVKALQSLKKVREKMEVIRE